MRKLEAGAGSPSGSSPTAVRSTRGTPTVSARSARGRALAGQELGVKATARNWTTVTKLLELASR